MMMKRKHEKLLMKIVGCIPVMLENGQVMVHYELLIEQNISLN
jgi:hypothetical protein